jgi:hypothetical protein
MTALVPPRRGIARRHRIGEVTVVAGLAVVLAVTVGGLFLLARDAPSAHSNSPTFLPTPFITADSGCEQFATYWMMQSGVKVDAATIEGLTNCWQAADGHWFVPISPSDARLPDGFGLTAAERDATNALRQRLLAEISELDGSLSSSIEHDLDSIYDPRLRPVTGHLKDGVSIGRARGRYTRVVQAFLISPENKELAGYIGWLMARKIQAYNALNDACQSDPATAYLRTVCGGLSDSLSVRFPPYLWDLRNATTLEAYLAYAVRSGLVDPSPAARSQAPTIRAWVMPDAT